jgi:VanZ family protein
MTRFLRYWAPVLAWMALIFTASGDAASVQRSDGILATLFRWLHISVTPSQLEFIRLIARKGAHMAEYMVLALLCWRALMAGKLGWSRSVAILAVAISIAYACSDEFHQTFVDGRSGSPLDVLIDTIGALIGIACIWIAQQIKARQQRL